MGISTATELVILNPSILGDKSIHNLLHGQVWDELVLGQFLTCHRIKVTNPLWIERQSTSHQQEVKETSCYNFLSVYKHFLEQKPHSFIGRDPGLKKSADGLRKMLAVCEEFACSDHVRFNPAQTQLIWFGSTLNSPCITSFIFCGQCLTMQCLTMFDSVM